MASFSSLDQLEVCLEGLETDIERGVEVLICRAASGAELATLGQAYPAVTIVEVPEDADVFALRARGLERASRPLVAFLEDHVTIPETWAAALLDAFAEGHDVVGGPVEPSESPGLNEWSLYLVEYGVYRGPQPAGPTAALSGVNVAYRRQVLETLGVVGSASFYESDVNEAFVRSGGVLSMEPAAAVSAALTMPISAAASHLFDGARRYASHRTFVLDSPLLAGLRALAFPLTALVLWQRAARRSLRRRPGGVVLLVLSFPVTVFLFLAWTSGEAAGYLHALGEDPIGEDR